MHLQYHCTWFKLIHKELSANQKYYCDLAIMAGSDTSLDLDFGNNLNFCL